MPLLFLAMSCTAPKVDNIVIEPKLTSTKQALGQGVSMLIPMDYRKGDTDEGYTASFETENQSSSLSLQVTRESLAQIKSAYSPKSLEENGQSLSEISTVEYGDNKKAFFAKVHDHGDSVFDYILAIEQHGQTYLIEAACTDISHDFYDYKIRQSLLSVYIE